MMKRCFYLYLIFVFLLTGCAEMFQGKVDMPVGSGGGTLSGMLSEKVAITELAAPAQLNVSKGDSSTSIDLNWSAVEGAVSYLVQRAEVLPNAQGGYDEPTEELFEDLEKMVYGTTYRDTTATKVNARYYYRVSAENNRDKLESSPFTQLDYGTLFGVPGNLRADLGLYTDRVNVYWDKVEYATAYEIHRGTDASGAGSVRLATVTADRTKYTNTISTDDQGKEFYYTVYAVNRNDQLSTASSPQLGFALVAGAPSQPMNVQVTNGRGTTTASITIKWDPVTAASDTVTYYVYRSSSEDSALLLVGGGKDITEYTDSRSLKTGVYYYYQVQAAALDEAGTELKSKFSDSGRLTSDGKENKKAAEGFILSPPDEVFAEKVAGQEQITIKFSPAIGNEAERAAYVYKVYGDTSQTGSFATEVASQNASALELNSEGYYTMAVASHSYYKVVTENGDTKSKPSSVVAPTPFAAVTKKGYGGASEAANFSFRESDANGSGVYPVKITWSKPDNDTPAGYHVYRSSSKDTGYRKITSDPISPDAVLEYLDANDTAKAGKKYWYKVLSVNSLGQGSHYSDPVQGWGALTHEQYLVEFYKTISSSLKKLTLMHKPDDMAKLGTESKAGSISGSLRYEAEVVGFGAEITMYYNNYADFYIDGNKDNGTYFVLTGNTNTTADMSSNGSMHGTVNCEGMYPGKVYHDKVAVKGGAAGGGTYGVEPQGFGRVEVPYNKVK